jgi:flagellar basal-body rod protein FlgF
VDIGSDGTVSVVPQGEGPQAMAMVGRMRIVEATPGQLTRGLDGLMRAAAGRELAPGTGPSLTSGALEGSNVDATSILVSMIQLARQFEMQVRVLHTNDENARSANSLLSSR